MECECPVTETEESTALWEAEVEAEMGSLGETGAQIFSSHKQRSKGRGLHLRAWKRARGDGSCRREQPNWLVECLLCVPGRCPVSRVCLSLQESVSGVFNSTRSCVRLDSISRSKSQEARTALAKWDRGREVKTKELLLFVVGPPALFAHPAFPSLMRPNQTAIPPNRVMVRVWVTTTHAWKCNQWAILWPLAEHLCWCWLEVQPPFPCFRSSLGTLDGSCPQLPCHACCFPWPLAVRMFLLTAHLFSGCHPRCCWVTLTLELLLLFLPELKSKCTSCVLLLLTDINLFYKLCACT